MSVVARSPDDSHRNLNPKIVRYDAAKSVWERRTTGYTTTHFSVSVSSASESESFIDKYCVASRDESMRARVSLDTDMGYRHGKKG